MIPSGSAHIIEVITSGPIRTSSSIVAGPRVVVAPGKSGYPLAVVRESEGRALENPVQGTVSVVELGYQPARSRWAHPSNLPRMLPRSAAVFLHPVMGKGEMQRRSRMTVNSLEHMTNPEPADFDFASRAVIYLEKNGLEIDEVVECLIDEFELDRETAQELASLAA
jgi:hypothetical protein